MDIKGLKLRDIHNYNDITIDELIFGSSKISICINSWSEKLEDIKIIKGTYIGDIPVSETHYDRTFSPVLLIQAGVGFKSREGFINAVIRPDICKDMGSEYVAQILPGAPHRLHFYYENFDNPKQGLSSFCTPKQLSVEFIEWDAKDYEIFKKQFLMNPKNTIPPDFEVDIDCIKNPDSRKYGCFQIIS